MNKFSQYDLKSISSILAVILFFAAIMPYFSGVPKGYEGNFFDNGFICTQDGGKQAPAGKSSNHCYLCVFNFVSFGKGLVIAESQSQTEQKFSHYISNYYKSAAVLSDRFTLPDSRAPPFV